mmetsp:Transcript_31631/g.36529  ORF Transcript_31631/g.36529 Transcript_31631/m.36529 type:complete len:167 (+) Transcript_31631:59-559(+)
MSSPAQKFVGYVQNTSWLGTGEMKFPTLESMSFGCLLKFVKPTPMTKSYFLMSSLESWKTGKRGEIGMHYENGFLRVVGDKELEWSIAHNFGITEVCQGVVEDSGLRAVFQSTHLGNANVVKATRRDMTVTLNAEGQPVQLRDVMSMATPDVPDVTEHLIIDYVQR